MKSEQSKAMRARQGMTKVSSKKTAHKTGAKDIAFKSRETIGVRYKGKKIYFRHNKIYGLDGKKYEAHVSGRKLVLLPIDGGSSVNLDSGVEFPKRFNTIEDLGYPKASEPPKKNLRKPTEKERDHETMRIDNAIDKYGSLNDAKESMRSRISKIKDPQKMYNYALELENENIHDVARDAYDALEKMGYDTHGKAN